MKLKSDNINENYKGKIFLKNFRGFSHAFVEFTNINFLVGENSSGKSSFLAAMKILEESVIPNRVNFNDDKIQLGSFDEIVSINSEKKEDFYLGITEEGPNRNQIYLQRYINDKGLPSIDKIFYMYNNYGIYILYNAEFISVKTEKIDPQKSIETITEEAVSQLSSSAKDFKRVSLEANRDVPLVALLHGIFTRQDIPKTLDFKINVKNLIPLLTRNFQWIAPIRIKPERLYEPFIRAYSPEGQHAPYMLKELLSSQGKNIEYDRNILLKYGKKSGLFKDIRTNDLTKSKNSPFSVDVQIGPDFHSLLNVGYGVSQVLPIIMELMAAPRGSIFAIQQPEVHLHPKAQANLGHIFYTYALKENKTFFIETHSDYLVDRVRLHHKKSKLRVGVKILFFENIKGLNKVSDINVDSDGSYSGKSMTKYRKFFLDEQIDLLSL